MRALQVDLVKRRHVFQYVSGILVRRKTGKKTRLMRVPNRTSVNLFNSILPSTVMVGRSIACASSRFASRQQCERKMQPARRLSLIAGVLCRDPEDGADAFAGEVPGQIAESAGLRGATPGPRDVIPTVGQRYIRATGHRVEEEHGPSGQMREVNATAIGGGQPGRPAWTCPSGGQPIHHRSGQGVGTSRPLRDFADSYLCSKW